ncbi:MAG TPA: bifunctional phosphoglucose/phosphomannose isomerase [Acidimicrobiia bacterium]|nr:bifunctional phosphoglucose/phosphomannose isomerase [Acidimicrobiia bacterium]
MPTDSLDFLEQVGRLPEQLAAASEAARAVPLDGVAQAGDIDNIVVVGLGGSGIAGDVLASVTSGELPVPVTVLKRIRPPAFVGPRTLVFALSYSGGTEETLLMTRGCLDAGAHVVAVTRGGRLGEMVEARGGRVVACPDGFMARAGLGALVAPLFVLLARVGVLADVDAPLGQAGEQLARRRDRCRPEITGAANPARELARVIGRTIPIVYGTGALGAVAAYRWKCDVNENAKAPAFCNAYPELAHNEVCGWGQHGDVTRQVLTLVQLRHGFEHERLAPRVAATTEIIEETLSDVLTVVAEGEGRLAQLLDLMYLGDWTSCYLALDNDVDPGPVDAISQLEERVRA